MIKRGLTITLFYLLCFCRFGAYAQQNNIALHKPVLASSESKAFPASRITDGVISRNGKWEAGTSKAPHTVEIDLKKYYNITAITVHSGITDQEKKQDEMTQAAGFWSVKNFKLQYWDDANWTDFPKGEVHENRLVAAAFPFKPAVTSYKIRLICDDGEPINIMEIEVFGAEAPNMPAPPTLTQAVSRVKKAGGLQKATITVTNKVVGKTLKYVGYNQGYYFPGSNISGWLEYANVNSLRVWATLNAFVPANTVQVDGKVTTVEEFDKRKNELRSSPEHNPFINWKELTPLYDKPDSSSTNAMVYNYALTESKRLGIDVILQIGSTDFSNDWKNKWMQWQRYYALAYHSAKTGDVTMFAMQNEPNHKNSGPMKLDQWISGAQIVSDAIHCAVEDVNKAYGKHLQGKFVGPVTAGQNTDWWAAVAKATHTDYHGKTVASNLVDLFSTHSYNSPAAGYASRISNIRKILEENHPEGKSMPIMYTEIGRWMNAYLIDKEETMDSPSLFTEWAGIYANNMKNGGYGMWAFKFANTASGPYPRGIKSGHHYIWQGRRIIEDAYKNLALNKPVKTSTSSASAQFVTDGNKGDNSAWQSGNGAEKEKWVEIDLGKPQEIGSAVVYTGSADGVYTSPDRIKNFKLQYLQNGSWLDIPGMEEKASKYSQIFTIFKSAVRTSKVRFISTDAGNLKIREIKLFAKGDEPSSAPDYNVSGIQRTGEVVRLFAKGFKDERKLLQTNNSVPDDTDLDTYTSYDAISGNYYMWLVQRSLQSYQLSINLSKLKISANTPITAETVNGTNYGEVTQLINLANTGRFNLTLPPQSVMLLTIPSNIKPVVNTLQATAAVTVKGGKDAVKNFNLNKFMSVQLDAANPANNQVAYVKFNLPSSRTTIKRCILSVSGHVNVGDRPYRLHVYGIPQTVDWNAKTLSWNSAPLLDKQEALIHNVGKDAFVAGEIAFGKIEKRHYLDVTDLVKKHGASGMTFVLVRETRQLGDDEDKGRTVIISNSVAAPQLKIWQ
ncbi:discoidin domain-containing protein [Mucilaginibacter sp. PAMB04168]|uniref:discoidin domain-containing protein n=1 Tax=Mucilaginibacter sp. PAMB04168 TaxID=3138567 RepID=UPI0031F70E33